MATNLTGTESLTLASLLANGDRLAGLPGAIPNLTEAFTWNGE